MPKSKIISSFYSISLISFGLGWVQFLRMQMLFIFFWVLCLCFFTFNSCGFNSLVNVGHCALPQTSLESTLQSTLHSRLLVAISTRVMALGRVIKCYRQRRFLCFRGSDKCVYGHFRPSHSRRLFNFCGLFSFCCCCFCHQQPRLKIENMFTTRIRNVVVAVVGGS